MSDESELLDLLPSRQIDRVSGAIGRRLVEIERIFLLDRTWVAESGLHHEGRSFRENSGPTRFVFEGGFSVAFGEWGEQLSVVVLTAPFEPDVHQRLYRLSESGDNLAALLGGICRDVRIWTYREDFEATEAMECAVSFLLDGGEVFYCTWLHGDMDTDYLLPGREVPRGRVGRCYSVAKRGPIAPDGGSDA